MSTNTSFGIAANRFGLPKPRRVAELAHLLNSPSGATTRIIFQGQTVDLPIIRITIDLPKYRLLNGRTTSLQAEYLAKNPNVRRDFFSGDSELWETQVKQHELLLDLAKQADLRKYFEDATQSQVEPILLDEYGFVVNGNRRLATWRDLLHQDRAKYGHYQHIDVAVLPHCDEKEIDRLEAKLQITKDIRADYSWDARANMMLAKQRRDNFSNRELADLYDMKELDIQELFDMRAYAEEFLKSRGLVDHWSRVAGSEFSFRRIANGRPKITGIGKQEVFKEAAFALIDNPDEAGGRVYEAIPSILNSLDEVATKLMQGLNVELQNTSDDELDSIFGDEANSDGTQRADIALAQEIRKPENATAVRKIIVEVLESQRQLKKDSKTANYLLDCCAKAQTNLANAVREALRPDSKLDGVLQQLAEIDSLTLAIREFVNSHANR